MKTYKRLFEKVVSFENLLLAAQKAQRAKRMKRDVSRFNFGLEKELLKLQEELRSHTYRHGAYRQFYVSDPKKRLISAAPFRDRVVHHAVHDVIEPIIDKSFIYDSYACRKGKGTHKAVDRAQSFLRANRYCFHGDIKKYFPSIDHGILRGLVRRRVADEDLLWLLGEIVGSAVEVSQLAGLRVSVLAGKPVNRLTGQPANMNKGLPIGNLTSQFFANLYLNELDYYVKFELKTHYYLRYMDDFLIFGNSRKALQEIKAKIRRFLKDRLALSLHEGKSQIFRTKDGIKFLGFRLYKDYRRLASDNVRRFRRRLRETVVSGEWSVASDSIRCWLAHARYADTVGLVGLVGLVSRLASSPVKTGQPANRPTNKGELK